VTGPLCTAFPNYRFTLL